MILKKVYLSRFERDCASISVIRVRVRESQKKNRKIKRSTGTDTKHAIYLHALSRLGGRAIYKAIILLTYYEARKPGRIASNKIPATREKVPKRKPTADTPVFVKIKKTARTTVKNFIGT